MTIASFIPDLVCPRCLRYFSNWSHLSKVEDIKLSQPGLLRHQKTCKLTFTRPLVWDEKAVAYCIAPESSMCERRKAFFTAKTMHASEEVPGDMIGWYPNREPKQYAFLPVHNGQVAGFVSVSWRSTVFFQKHSEQWVKVDDVAAERWVVEKLWVYHTHRRNGVAAQTVLAIANFFETEVASLGWLCPLTKGGEALVTAITGSTAYLCI
jgi:hypothetical protein